MSVRNLCQNPAGVGHLRTFRMWDVSGRHHGVYGVPGARTPRFAAPGPMCALVTARLRSLPSIRVAPARFRAWGQGHALAPLSDHRFSGSHTPCLSGQATCGVLPVTRFLYGTEKTSLHVRRVHARTEAPFEPAANGVAGSVCCRFVRVPRHREPDVSRDFISFSFATWTTKRRNQWPIPNRPKARSSSSSLKTSPPACSPASSPLRAKSGRFIASAFLALTVTPMGNAGT
jgi:hypothetical protein